MENIIVLFEATLKQGKMEDFADYKITVVSPVRSYTMGNREEAPAASNSFGEGN